MPRLPDFYYNQMGKPAGRLANTAARWMNLGNRIINGQAIARLGAVAGERVIDVGYGGGLGLRKLLTAGCRVVGLDPSRPMARYCGRHLAPERLSGRLALIVGEVEHLPLADASIDKALAVNTIYFWHDPGAGFSELRRVLRPGGTLVVATSAARTCRFFGFGSKDLFIPNPDTIRNLARLAGFRHTAIERHHGPGGTRLVVCTAP
jgi:SAM-dependent methyltransferase